MNIDRDRIPRAVISVATRSESELLVAVRSTSHTEVARRLGVPKQTYQDWRDEHLKDFLLIAACYGLKLVPHDAEAYVSDDIAAMQHMALKGVLSLRPIVKQGGTVEDVDISLETRPGAL